MGECATDLHCSRAVAPRGVIALSVPPAINPDFLRIYCAAEWLWLPTLEALRYGKDVLRVTTPCRAAASWSLLRLQSGENRAPAVSCSHFRTTRSVSQLVVALAHGTKRCGWTIQYGQATSRPSPARSGSGLPDHNSSRAPGSESPGTRRPRASASCSG